MKQAWCVLAFICLTLPTLATAQMPQGAEFRVNSYTTDVQTMPSVVGDAEHGYLVSWTSHGQDGSGEGVYVRRFGGGGRRLGPEFQVNTYTAGGQQGAGIACRPGRGAVVAWQSSQQDGSNTSVYARRLDVDGRPLGAEFRVHQDGAGGQAPGPVAMDDAGGFLIVWFDVPTYQSWARRFNAQGAPLGAEVAVGAFGATSAAALPGGGFVVVGEGGDPHQARGRRLDDGGVPLGSEFLLGTSTAEETSVHVAATGPDGLVAVWDSRTGTGSTEVHGRLFDAQFAPRGAEFKVSTLAYLHQVVPTVAGGDNGGFTVAWINRAPNWHLNARRFDAGGIAHGAEFQVDVDNPYFLSGRDVALAAGGQILVVWTPGLEYDIFGRQYGLLPQALAVDATADVSNGNGVLEAGETVRVAPTWLNQDQSDRTFFGTAFSFTGPGNPGAYSVRDVTGSYGLVADGASGSCEATGDCYRVALASTARPALHWDATLEETLSSRYSMRWPVHVGGTFSDVSTASGYYRFVETLLHRGITSGCTSTAYCPAASTTREQMAAFVLVAAEGAGYQPPACAVPVFADVPAASPFCPFVEELARRQVVTGCGGGLYCPQAPVSRAEMAIFVLRTLDPALSPPACGVPVFADVPASSPFCRWIEELARRGIAAGCGGGDYCPTAPVTREQMAVFIAVGFGLSLYGP